MDSLDAPPAEADYQAIWTARSTWCGTIINVLTALMRDKASAVGPHASVEVSEAGLVISIVEGVSLHGMVTLKRELFDDWDIVDGQPDPLQFCVPLGQMLDCLKMFSGETSPDRPHTLYLDFREVPKPCLSLRLVEGPSVHECELSAVEVESPAKPPLPGKVPARVVWEAPMLRVSGRGRPLGSLERRGRRGAKAHATAPPPPPRTPLGQARLRRRSAPAQHAAQQPRRAAPTLLPAAHPSP